MGHINIIHGGLLTTIQDKGRTGLQQYGMPVAGAMDDFSLRIANLLVGNMENEAVLEATLAGPEMQFNASTVIAVTGANMQPVLNARPMPMWRSIRVNAGDTLGFLGLKTGCRSYISFTGGIDVKTVMGSKSTYTRGGIGGYMGRKLGYGDVLDLGPAACNPEDLINRWIPFEHIPDYRNCCEVRVVLGPQDDHFTSDALESFFSSTYEITNEADRMGYRLYGPKLQHTGSADIISDGITLGSIQVPGHGMPIIMLADHQTTGGYPKIATVISPDIPVLAQLKPGDKIKFKELSIEEAHQALREYEARLYAIAQHIENERLIITKSRVLQIAVNNIPHSHRFEVLVEELKV